MRFHHVALAGAALLALIAFRPAPASALPNAHAAVGSDSFFQLVHKRNYKHSHRYTKKRYVTPYRYNAPRYSRPYGYSQPYYSYPRQHRRNSGPAIYFRF